MRSIREVCVRDHGEDEIRGWGNRELGDRWTRALREDDVWVVESTSGVIGGYAHLQTLVKDGERRAHIFGLYLTPECLGHGLGGQLGALMLERARAFGAARVTLESSLTAHGFYQKLGFRDVGPLSRANIGGSLVRYYPMELRL